MLANTYLAPPWLLNKFILSDTAHLVGQVLTNLEYFTVLYYFRLAPSGLILLPFTAYCLIQIA